LAVYVNASLTNARRAIRRGSISFVTWPWRRSSTCGGSPRSRCAPWWGVVSRSKEAWQERQGSALVRIRSSVRSRDGCGSTALL